jgi:flavorubredoxin
MKGLKPQNEIAAAFGSYGRSGEAVRWIIQEFEEMKVKIIDCLGQGSPDGTKRSRENAQTAKANCSHFGPNFILPYRRRWGGE